MASKRAGLAGGGAPNQERAGLAGGGAPNQERAGLAGGGAPTITKRRLLWPALTTAVLASLGLALCVWQLERLQWKTGVLAELDRAEAAAPVPLRPDPAPFEKVQAAGTWDTARIARYGSEVRNTTAGPVIGAQIVMPLDRPDGPPLLVDRGWLPDTADPATLPAAPEVTGYVRPSEHTPFLAPGDDLAARRFWALDPAKIGAALGLPSVIPFTLVALGADTGALQPAHALPRPPNDHLGYALTWFSLAAIAVAVFIVYARRKDTQ